MKMISLIMVLLLCNSYCNTLGHGFTDAFHYFCFIYRDSCLIGICSGQSKVNKIYLLKFLFLIKT